MNKANYFLLLLLVLLSTSSCTFLSGYDGKASFSCKAPDGVLCESMSGIYANTMAHNLPGQAKAKNKQSFDQVASQSLSKQNFLVKSKQTIKMPLRSKPRVLRIWFAPWEEKDGSLHGQSIVYLKIDSGHWLVESLQDEILEQQRQEPKISPNFETKK